MAANMGVLVTSWPIGLGADASGVIVEVGQDAKEKYGFEAGQYVCGCTRIGQREYSTAREFFLMDAQVAMRRPSNLSLAEAATIGAAFQTASIGLFVGLQVSPPKQEASTDAKGWILVLGGAGSVGRAGVQLARASGCNVVASCSEKSFDSVKGIGASAVFDYHLSIDAQLEAIDKATSGATITKIFDATSAADPALAKALFRRENTKGQTKNFSTTNDWSGIGDFEGGKTYEIDLGKVGRPDEEFINNAVEKFNPMITSLFEAGVLRPQEQEEIGSGGLEDAIKAYKHKAGSRKVVVKLQDE